jgi:hydroxyacylglutathione hydrolase
MLKNVKMLDPNAKAPVELANGVYALTSQGSISYLVTGEKQGLVIDTGFGRDDVLAAAREATDLPLLLVNTHGHGDHIGCNEKFEKAYAHPLEHEKISRKNKEIVPVTEGYVFDLGGRRLEVIEIPGHTPGGIALLDRENKLIFTGDMIYKGAHFLQFDYSNLNDYVASMDKLIALGDDIGAIFCCHGGDIPIDIEHVKKARALAIMLIEGKEVESEPVHLQTEDGEFDVNKYTYDGASIFYK